MAENEFQVESMGEVYAQALINEAQKNNALDAVADDIEGIGQLLKTNKQFLSFTQALTISDEKRMAALDKIFTGRIHPLTLSAIKSMARRDRLMFLRGLVEAFAAIRRKMSGLVDAEVTAAAEIRPQVLEKLKTALSKSNARVADLKVKLDAALIGGMTVRIGDTLIDGSVATQLEKIRTQLQASSTMKLESVLG